MDIVYDAELVCEETTCVVCTEKASDTKLNCNHDGFCIDCIERWYKKSSTCPLCRVQIEKVCTSNVLHKELSPKEEVYWELYDLIIKYVKQSEQVRYMETIYPIVKKYPPNKLLMIYNMYKGQIELELEIRSLPMLLKLYYRYKALIRFRLGTS